MTIQKSKIGTALTLTLEGRLDTTTVPELEQLLWNELYGVTELILDFAGIEYISSAGLRVLLSTQKQMNEQGSMTVKNVSEMIMQIFEVTGFTEILTIE